MRRIFQMWKSFKENYFAIYLTRKRYKMILGEMREEDILSQQDKIMLKVLSGAHDRSMKFHELQKLLYMLEFQCRVKGDHFIY